MYYFSIGFLLFNFRFVHRLDYATSGILCLGLNRNATKHLAWKFKHQEVTKYYLALVSLLYGFNCILKGNVSMNFPLLIFPAHSYFLF